MTQEQIKQYKVLMEFLSKTLGPYYEITLHDISDRNKSIVAIENGSISGRTVGAPLTNIALKVIMDKSYKYANYKINYGGLTNGNKKLRSSTLFLKNAQNELEGLLCITFDDSRYAELSRQVLKLCHPDSFVDIDPSGDPNKQSGIEETYPETLSALIDNVILEALHELDTQVERLTQDEKMKIITILNNEKVFLLKGAVGIAAEKLACSQASIYRYLSKLKEETK